MKFKVADQARKAFLTLCNAMLTTHMPKRICEQDPDERAALINPDNLLPYTATPPLEPELLKTLKAGLTPPSTMVLHNIVPELQHTVATPLRTLPSRKVNVGVIEILDEDNNQEFSVCVISTQKNGNAIDIKTEHQELTVHQETSPLLLSTRFTFRHMRYSLAISMTSAVTKKRRPSLPSIDGTPVNQKRQHHAREGPGQPDEESQTWCQCQRCTLIQTLIACLAKGPFAYLVN